MTDKPQITYRNTDLDLVASRSLESLASELETLGVNGRITHGEDGFLYVGDAGGCVSDPDTSIVQLLNAIESLSESGRQIWAGCSKREFDVGYDCGDEPWSFNQGLTNETLRRMAACGATFRITLYPFRPDDSSDAEPRC